MLCVLGHTDKDLVGIADPGWSTNLSATRLMATGTQSMLEFVRKMEVFRLSEVTDCRYRRVLQLGGNRRRKQPSGIASHPRWGDSHNHQTDTSVSCRTDGLSSGWDPVDAEQCS